MILNENNKKIAIIGSGAMGSAMAKVLYDAGNKNIIVYGIDEQELNDLKQGKNTKYFDKTVKLPNLATTKDLKKAVENADYIVLAIPSNIIDKIFRQILEKLDKSVLIICASKGFYPNSSYSLHQGLLNEAKDNKFIKSVVTITGPSHAEEIVLEQLTAICAVDYDIKNAEEVQKLFSNKYFKLYAQDDVIGAEVGAAFKNVLAICAGMAHEAGYGINTLAAILSRGLNEMRLYNEKMGGKTRTLLGLTGVGDLFVTATSNLSRNFTFGREFYKNGKLALNSSKTIEGLTALKHIYEINKQFKVDLPIVESLYDLIYQDGSLEKLKENIWFRSLKKEFEN